MKSNSKSAKLSKNDIVELVSSVQEYNDREALNQLVLEYSALVETIAKRYSKGGFIHEDLVQVGMIGLLNSINRFDQSFGGKFETFAFPTIIGEMKRFLRDKTWSVHVPRRAKELYPKINNVVEEFTLKHERSPKIDEIANILNVSEECIIEVIEMAQSYRSLSIDHSIDGDEDGAKFSILDVKGQSEIGYEKVEQTLTYEKAADVLSEREKNIINATFIDGLSQKEAGQRLGISQMHVSRIQRKALDKLKTELSTESEIQDIMTTTVFNECYSII